MLFVPPGGPYALVPMQVLRSFHLIYAVGVVLCGGLLAALVSRSRLAGISVVSCSLPGCSSHKTSPGRAATALSGPGLGPPIPASRLSSGFATTRRSNAVFAFNPELVYLPLKRTSRASAPSPSATNSPMTRMRASSQSMPRLADRWARQRNAALNVDRMTDAQRIAALKPLGATWLLLPPEAETSVSLPVSKTPLSGFAE